MSSARIECMPASSPYYFNDDLMSPTTSSSNIFFEPPRLGPCELQDPVWGAKMSAVVQAPNKKKRKTETKPQAALNKCLNEKRRREQENRYIEELAELISARFADMNTLSVKPDKCAILQETVNQIRNIKQTEDSTNSDAVQQGEVSSSKPTLLANNIFGPLLLEALEGFLFLINSEHKVEFVTDNVSQFIKFTRDEVLREESIFNIIHHGDHARFTTLLPMSLGWTSIEPNTPKSRTINCRLLIKPDDRDETMEEKQQRVSKYENMQISSTQVPSYLGEKSSGTSGERVSGEDFSEMGPWVMCIARRMPPNEKQLATPIEQFTMKLDTSGKIIGVDTSGVSSTYSQYLNKDLINRLIQELCDVNDQKVLTVHLKDTMASGKSTSGIYKLRISSQDKYIHVQTKSKLFKASGHEMADFIMATHSIIGDSDIPAVEASSPHIPSIPTCTPDVLQNDNTNTAIMTSLEDFDFPSSTSWEVERHDPDGGGDERNITCERPESRQSMASAPSPSLYFSSGHTFSPLQETPSLEEPKKEKIFEKEKDSENGESARLRNLLTSSKRVSTDSDDGRCQNKSSILKEYHNVVDEGDPTPGKVSTGNDMLLQLLNTERNEDDVEAQADKKKQNKLLQQLLKQEEKTKCHQETDPILISLGFKTDSPSPPDRSTRKRSSEDGDSNSNAKRPSSIPSLDTIPPTTVSTTGSGNSKLWERNKMLASLLAQEPSTTIIPHIPPSVISATPQDKLPRVVKQVPAGTWSGGSIQTGPGTVLRPNQHLVDAMARNRLSQPQLQQRQYGNQLLEQQQHANYDLQQTPPDPWEDPVLSDILDQVIDIVPDAVIDATALLNALDQKDPGGTNNSGTGGSGAGGNYQTNISEKMMAISAIQKSLMQCETAVKAPVYNTNTMSSNQQQFPPPPLYQQRPRFNLQSQLGARQGSPHYAIANQQQILIQRTKMLQQQQQKQRLLQQQQQQSLLIPSNAAAPVSDPGLHNIDSLITVAPNVSLQRSSSVPDSQLSPNGYGGGGGGPLLNSGNSQISPGQRQPYSPLSHQSPAPFSPVNGGMSGFQQPSQQQQGQARLSPSGLSSFQQSPRVSQGQQVVTLQQQSQAQQQQQQTQQQQTSQQQQTGNYSVMSQSGPPTPNQNHPAWSPQGSRLTLQQQQNPMLNAQLTGGAYNSRSGFTQNVTGPSQRGATQLPPVRSLTSPGSRQSPFPPDVSPTTVASYQQSSGQFRLQRTISGPPQATTQLPGGVRHYSAGLKDHTMPPSYPSHPHQHPPPHHMMYPPDSPQPQPQFCYDQATLQYYGASCDRGRQPSGGNNGMTEYVRQELRAMVGARTSGVGGSGPPRPPSQQIQIAPGQQVSSADLEALGLNFETSGGESPKLWATVGPDLSAVSPQQPPGHPSRTSMDDVSRSSDQKASLLQKLLSE